MPTAAQKPVPATAADLLAIPEEQRFHEIVDGELVQKAVPSFEHGDAQSAIVAHVKLPFQRRPGGRWPGGWWFATEVEVELAPDQVYRPDVVGWRRERSPERPSESPVRLRPDWVCEVLSPNNARHDTVKKMRAYQRFQLPHYWIVDPREDTLTVYRWTPEGYLVALRAERGERVRAEPFDAIELQIGVLFGDEREDE
ncbi:Uma2 family endonuclease [Sorangium sp. So ce388]|uniref:Uma2 family endonuclease n=1 Tax=Sorangium sp. So ce388 TaxID=3133309 RepID=UPI003F5C2C20